MLIARFSRRQASAECRLPIAGFSRRQPSAECQLLVAGFLLLFLPCHPERSRRALCFAAAFAFG